MLVDFYDSYMYQSLKISTFNKVPDLISHYLSPADCLVLSTVLSVQPGLKLRQMGVSQGMRDNHCLGDKFTLLAISS